MLCCRSVTRTLRDLKIDVDTRMDEMSMSLKESNLKTAKELNDLRNLVARTHIDVELMKKKWIFSVAESDREKFMDELVAGGKASRENSDSK